MDPRGVFPPRLPRQLTASSPVASAPSGGTAPRQRTPRKPEAVDHFYQKETSWQDSSLHILGKALFT